jgi:hypothetical protein
MIPGFVGKNFEEWLKKNDLPKTVSQYGSKPEEIFINWERVKEIVGPEEMKKIPFGAIGVFSFVDKLRVGFQQLMAGSRCFRVHAITRAELMSLTQECTEVTGIPYVMGAGRKAAMEILDSMASYSII